MSSFDADFETLTGHAPFPWQRRLFDEWLSIGKLPSAVDIPTGLGKTAVMAVWLLARARGAALPRRLVYVVDRRAVVDQATDFAERLRGKLKCSELERVREGLGLRDRSLPISTLRGRHADNREWLEDPAAPAIIVGTVDMIGSRLLFEGYGVSRRMRPNAAGLMGCDSLVVLDEAHLVGPFECLLRMIEREQRVSAASDGSTVSGAFAGPAASAKWPPPFRVLPLSATLSRGSGSQRFQLCNEDREDRIVRERIYATKTLTIEDIGKGSQLENELSERAWQLSQEENNKTGEPVRMLIYCDSRKVAEKVADNLGKQAKTLTPKPVVILFVGGRRVHEREEAANELKCHGLIAGNDSCPTTSVFVVATSAGEVGVDLDADHMICDLVAWERMVQRLGRVNRRGMGKARVLVIDQGPPEEKRTGKGGVHRHSAVRELLEALPRIDADGHRAGPAALADLGSTLAQSQRMREATTPMPLRPALSRPLVDAWAMTSLAEHAGRPEVEPWLRGWTDDDGPRTTLIWRRYLPVRFEGASVRMQPGEVGAFFEAAAPQTAELLETETWRAAEWLKKRSEKLRKPLHKKASDRPAPDDNDAEKDDDADGLQDSVPLSPLNPEAPIVFLLGQGSGDNLCLNLKTISSMRKGDLERRLAGRGLVVDARLFGVKEGLLDAACDNAIPTIEDNWGHPEAWDEVQLAMRVRTLKDEERNELLDWRAASPGDSGRSSHPWQEALALPYRVSPEGKSIAWLVVDKRRGGDSGEEARAIAPKLQSLDEHQACVADEAARTADALDLPAAYRMMLIAAARHHDDGKRSPRWQRAFNAPRKNGPYAKTEGPINRHVLNGYRHEFQSVLDAKESGLDGLGRSDPLFELALHLIASHHGNARPAIGIDGCDTLPPTAAASEAHDIALRFARLQRQWGPWGLAWWEALLRAADRRASQALDEAVTRERTETAEEASPVSVAQGDLFANPTTKGL